MKVDHVEGPLHVHWWKKEGHPYLTRYISSFLFYFLFFESHIHGEGMKSMMDHLERRGRIHVALALLLVFAYNFAACAWYANIGAQWRMGECLDFGICFKNKKMSDHSVCALKRDVGFTNRLFLFLYLDYLGMIISYIYVDFWLTTFTKCPFYISMCS